MWIKVLFLLLFLSLCSCFVKAEDIYTTATQDLVNNIRYVKDPKTGFCYAVIITRGSYYDTNITGFTYVPCDKTGL